MSVSFIGFRAISRDVHKPDGLVISKCKSFSNYAHKHIQIITAHTETQRLKMHNICLVRQRQSTVCHPCPYMVDFSMSRESHTFSLQFNANCFDISPCPYYNNQYTSPKKIRRHGTRLGSLSNSSYNEGGPYSVCQLTEAIWQCANETKD